MKLTAEQIRQRAAEIVAGDRTVAPTKWQEQAIVALVEDATGEKLPPAFDASKVTHGSVWQEGGYTFVVMSNSCSHATDKNSWSLVGVGRGSDWQYIHCTASSHADIVKELNDYTYLGQYDFAAGIPKAGGAK